MRICAVVSRVALLAVSLAVPAVANGATFTVTAPDDSGPGTLRQAILDANASGEASTIVFSRPLGINPQTPLPAITQPGVTIEGRSPTTGPPEVEIDGIFVDAPGLDVEADNVSIFGVAVAFFGLNDSASVAPQIKVGPVQSTVIEECYAGLEVGGVDPFAGPTTGPGILLSGSKSPLLVDDFVGAVGDGVVITGSPQVQFIDVVIGLSIDRLTPAPIIDTGVVIQNSVNVLIGFGSIVTNSNVDLHATGSFFDVNQSRLGVDEHGNVSSGQARVLADGGDQGFVLGNVIAGGTVGVSSSGPNVEVEVQDNSMFGFSGGGSIDIGGDGITGGPFSLSPSADPTRMHVSGTGAANASYTLQLFTDDVANPGGWGSGMSFVENLPLSTDGGGNGALDFVVPQVARGKLLTISATDAFTTTTEFSPQLRASGSAVSLEQTVSDPGPVLPGTPETWTITASNAGPSDTDLTLTDVVPASLTLDTAMVSQGTVTLTPIGAGTEVDVDFGVVTSGGTAALVLKTTVLAQATRTVSNSASVASNIDSTAGDDSSTVSITVDVPPVAYGATTVTQEDVPVAIDALASDPDGDALQYAIVTSPSHGTLTGTLPDVTYHPSLHYRGLDSFVFTASDGTSVTSATTETIVVQAVNHAPVAIDDSYATDENVALSVPAGTGVLANDTDVEQGTRTALLVSSVAHGVLSLSSSGAFTYAPTPDYSGADSFSYVAWDGTSLSAPALVSIDVGAVLPPAPATASPATGEVLVSGEVTFVWLPVADPVGGGNAVSYHVTASRIGQPDITIDSAQTTATAKLGAGNWTWKVSTTTSTGTSPDSAPVGFEVKSVGGRGGCGCDLSRSSSGRPFAAASLGILALACTLCRRRRRAAGTISE